jgi:hypothetical protein
MLKSGTTKFIILPKRKILRFGNILGISNIKIKE